MGCRNGTTCPLKRAVVPGNHLTIEHPEFAWSARSTQVSISNKKNVYSCFHLLSDLFSHQGRCKVSLGEGFRRLLTRFFHLFFLLGQFESVFIESVKILWELGFYSVLITDHLVL